MKQHVGTCSCGTTVIIQSDDAKEITIPRDHYDLLKEAAEEWAKDRINAYDGDPLDCCLECREEYVGNGPIVHAADCRAARILGLEREEG